MEKKMKKINETTRYRLSKQFDCVLESIKNDKEQILDILCNYSTGCTISIPFTFGESPRYDLEYSRVSYEYINLISGTEIKRNEE